MVQYEISIYMPNAKSYDFAGFTTSQISFSTAHLQDKPAETDSQALALLNSIRMHSQFAAVVPDLFSRHFTHQFLTFAMSQDHPANVGIAIRASIEATTVTPFQDDQSPLLPAEMVKMSIHPIATLKLFKCQYVNFVPAEGDTYTLTFNVTGGDKFVLGAEPGMPGDFESSYERITGPKYVYDPNQRTP